MVRTNDLYLGNKKGITISKSATELRAGLFERNDFLKMRNWSDLSVHKKWFELMTYTLAIKKVSLFLRAQLS
ncbi:hypothetical protein BCU91_04970 [Shewanella sp. 10N.286.52.B9]|nr:hypothetical protein BCU91_04970 [Shewanella sp. 10N.286.52.B9]